MNAVITPPRCDRGYIEDGHGAWKQFSDCITLIILPIILWTIWCVMYHSLLCKMCKKYANWSKKKCYISNRSYPFVSLESMIIQLCNHGPACFCLKTLYGHRSITAAEQLVPRRRIRLSTNITSINDGNLNGIICYTLQTLYKIFVE